MIKKQSYKINLVESIHEISFFQKKADDFFEIPLDNSELLYIETKTEASCTHHGECFM